MKNLLILGAQSDIAKAIAKRFAAEGVNLCLGSIGAKALDDFAKDLEIRHKIKVKSLEFDAVNYKKHQQFYDKIKESVDGVIVVFGYLGDQKIAETDFKETENILDVNYKGAVSILNIIANDFETKKDGFIAGITSVAGDRGRQSNYIYGSAKAGFTAYLSGLRNRLSKCGVNVLTIKPGFVNTQMTADLDLPGLLTAEPDEVAENIYKAWKKGKSVLYTKWFWKYIMLIIKHIPEKIFKKLSM